MADEHTYPVGKGIITAVAVAAVAGIIGTVAGGLILSFIPSLRSFFIETMLWAWVGPVWIWTTLVSNYPVPGWTLLIVGSFALVGLANICVGLWPESEPAYRNYTEDMLYGAKWRWSWVGNDISNLCCFCPKCDAQLVSQLVYSENSDGTLFICEQCPPDGAYGHHPPYGRVVSTVRGGDRYYAVGAVKREILRRVRTGQYVPSGG